MRAAAAFDDRARMTEACPFARCFAADVGDHRLGDFSIDDQLRQFFLRRPDFAKDHDRFGDRFLFRTSAPRPADDPDHRVATDVHDG